MNAETLERKLEQEDGPVVVDVRSGPEFRRSHIPGAVHAPAMKILFGLAALPDEKDRELVVTCEHGPRAQVAAAMLRRKGYRNVELLEGHMAAWKKDGRTLAG